MSDDSANDGGARGTAGLALSAVAFVMVAVGLTRLFVTGSCESNAPPGQPSCPPGDLPYAVAAFAGVGLFFVAIFALRAARAFGLAFLAVGAAGLWAGFHPDGERWMIAFGLVFAFCGVAGWQVRR